MPAAYDNRQQPTDGLPWGRRGGEWFLERRQPGGPPR
jgi:hypothetical protein